MILKYILLFLNFINSLALNKFTKTANIYYEKDANPEIISKRKVAILGYGSQGHAHALNLKDSGVNVCVGLRENSSSINKAKNSGLNVKTMSDACAWADIIMILLPDTEQAKIYNEIIYPNLKDGDAILFAHGFNINYNLIKPPNNVDVIMIAPKGPGHLVRRTYKEGSGVPCLFAIEQDTSGKAKDLAISYANSIGGTKIGIIETTFKEECETDLFGEQAVLCGGLTKLVESGFETLVNAGYQPEICYFECLHELKLIVDLMYEQGITGMRYSISDTAEYGDLTRGSRIIDNNVRDNMKQILNEIQDGTFAKEWIKESNNDYKNYNNLKKEGQKHLIEKIGLKLRKMMNWETK